MGKEKLRIFIVDDHQIMIDGIKSLLENEDDFIVSGETTKATEVIDKLKNHPSDILITDINMPGLSGIELTREVKKVFPEIKVLGLSMFGDKATISSMLEAGVSGYVLKNTGREELVTALKKIGGGGLFFSDDVTLEMMKTITEKPSPITPAETNLTAREIQIVKLIAGEFNNASIGEQLFISERTVETHRKNIFRKTGTKSVAGLIKYAIERKII